MLFKIDHEKLEFVRGLKIQKIEGQRTISTAVKSTKKKKTTQKTKD